MMNVYQKLIGEYIIKYNESTVWDKKYGSKNQYIQALEVYLIEIVSLTSNISIDREPGHGTYVVDGLNEIDKGI